VSSLPPALEQDPALRTQGLAAGLRIHRNEPIAQWRAALAEVPEGLVRDVAEDYLQNIANRQRTAVALQRKLGR
jgi:hypothetical protein